MLLKIHVGKIIVYCIILKSEKMAIYVYGYIFFNVFNYSIATSDRHLVYPNTFVHVIVIFSNSFNRQAHIVVFIFVCNTDCKNVAATVYFLNHDSFTKCQHKFFLELQHLHSCTV